MPVFYLPVIVYLVVLSIKSRGLLFLSVNPALPMSGLIGEDKAALLSQIEGDSRLARFRLLRQHDGAERQIERALDFLLQIERPYPVVLKPNAGQRGQGVSIVRDEQALRDYIKGAEQDILVQEYIEGEEYGVFYARFSSERCGKIISITHKTFPVLNGDGFSSIERLIADNSRTHYMMAFLLDLHRSRLSTVLAKDEQLQIVEIGSHCRGSVFLDAGNKNSPLLEQSMQSIVEQIPGYFFGRFDLRLQKGGDLTTAEGVKILEINGLTSESTHIYDPKNPVWVAYRDLFKQWRLANQIGRENIANGSIKYSLIDLARYIYQYYFARR